jgi:hypothetical protein
MSRKRKRQTRKRSLSPQAVKRDRRDAMEFNPDYSHVIQDLRRIGVLAGSFILILVVLSFFLN